MKKTVSLLLISFAITAQAQITSTFDTDADGWTFLNSATSVPVAHNASNGNPGGYASVTYASNTALTIQNWIAPAKFLGNHLVRSLGMSLKFNLQQSQAGTGTGYDVRIENGGSFIYLSGITPKPAVAPTWTSYSFKLDETESWYYSSGATIATRAQIKYILTNVTSIEIRGTYASNASYTSGLDNVVLEQRMLPIAPSISSLSATSGKPGEIITINGSGFNPSASNNIVRFGAVAGTITNASATQLTVTIPTGAGYGKIAITNKVTGLTGTSLQPFNPLFEGGGRIIPASFAIKIDITLSTDIEGITATDIDGDGWIDLAVASSTAFKTIDIYRNLGLGGDITTASFAPKITVAIPGTNNNTTGLKFVDLDGDGKLDAITSNVLVNFGGSYFITYRNISTPGNIAFEAFETWAGNSDETPPYFVGDIDGDGRPELVGGEGSSGAGTNLWIAQNISSPGNIDFGASVGYFSATVDGLSNVTMDDLDGDGKPEMIASWFFGDRFSIIKNNSTPGNISLTDIGQILTQQYNSGLSIGDFNLDGKNDIVWKRTGTNSVYIRLNTNSGGPLAVTDFTTEVILSGDLNTYGGMSIADINGDGKPDIAASDNGDVGVFENVYSGGTFDASAFIPTYQYQGSGNSTYPTSPIAADLNGDGKPELIVGVTNSSPKKISIFQNNNVHAPVISLNTVSPLKGVIGSTVTITGNNFSTVPSENIVWFGTVKATVLTASENLLTVKVPAGAINAPVSVTKNGLTSRYHLPFQTTFGPGVTFDNTHFAPPISYTLTGASYNIEVGDLNVDGTVDVLASAGVTAYAFRNNYIAGAIAATTLVANDTLFPINDSFGNPRLEDFDGDGFLDVASTNTLIRKNITTGSNINFTPNLSYQGQGNLAYSDFNMDGKIDIAVANSIGGQLDLIENRTVPGDFMTTGSYASFSTAFAIGRPAADGDIISADLDSDGFPDVVTTNPNTDNISIFRNLGGKRITTAQFAARVDVAVGDNPYRIYKGDFDSDGKLDLLVYHWTGTSTTLLIVFQNTSTVGNISFSRIDLTNPSVATVAHVADLDGDGKPEILTTAEAGNQFSIFKNLHVSSALTAASFATPFNTTVTAPRAIATADINLDGKPEIILTRAVGLLVVYENLIPTGPTITITSQPTSTAVCDGATASLTLTATGANNLTYQWQKFDGSVFNNVSNGGGYSGATTATLAINTTGNFGAGDYRCLIKGDLAPDKFSNTVTLTVNVVPAAPTTNGNSNCIPAAITLTASGGTNGQYRWYDVATGGGPISGQVNSTYVTPVINTTTTYHVAINNGLCESSRASVIAAIAPIAKPTLIPSVQAAIGTINICAGDVLTITAPSGFTTYTWSNGASSNPTTITTSTSSLTLQVEDAAGCTSPLSDALNIVVNPYPIATITTNGLVLTASLGDSYKWYQNDVLIADATEQSFEFNVLEYGVYKVDVTDSGCTSTSTEYEYLITGLEHLSDGVKLYPNPVDKILTTEYNPPYSITIINTSGMIVGKVNSNVRYVSIDLSSFASGLYILQIKNENGIRYKRVTKK